MAKSVTKKETKSIVEPSLKFVGDSREHAIEALYNGPAEKLPVVKSVGFMRVPETNTYVSYTIFSKGTEVLKMEVGEPNLRLIVEDEAKIAFVSTFMDSEFSLDQTEDT